MFAAGHGAPPGLIHDLELAISEAATNSVLHAFVGRRLGRVELAIRARAGRLTACVIDDGVGMRPRLDSPGLGLGLVTILRLAAAVELRPGPDGTGTEVRMSFAVPGVGPAPVA